MSAPQLDPAYRSKIVSCLALVLRPGSEGERTAAAEATRRLLDSRGISIEQLIREPAPEQQRQDGWRDDLAACQRAAHRLTPWEANFCNSVAMQRTLSVKQASVLAGIARKVCA